MTGAGDVHARKMFGEYGVYCDGVFVGVMTAGRLFIKPTLAGDQLEPGLELAPAYKGAKPTCLIPPEMLDDPDRLVAFVRAARDELRMK